MPKATESRKERIDLMRKMLNENLGESNESISYDKFIAKFCLKTGVSKRTAQEYLNLLADSGEITLDPYYLVSQGQRIHKSTEQ